MSEVNFELQDLAEQERQSTVEVAYDDYVEAMYQQYCADRDEYDECYADGF